MKDESTEVDKESRTKIYEMLESLMREKAQGFIQDIFEEEMNEFLGRMKSGGE